MQRKQRITNEDLNNKILELKQKKNTITGLNFMEKEQLEKLIEIHDGFARVDTIKDPEQRNVELIKLRCLRRYHLNSEARERKITQSKARNNKLMDLKKKALTRERADDLEIKVQNSEIETSCKSRKIATDDTNTNNLAQPSVPANVVFNHELPPINFDSVEPMDVEDDLLAVAIEAHHDLRISGHHSFWNERANNDNYERHDYHFEQSSKQFNK